MAGSDELDGSLEELEGSINVAVMQLDIGEVPMLGRDHALIAQLEVQIDALLVQDPGGGVVASHPDRHRLEMDRHPLEPSLTGTAGQPPPLAGKGLNTRQVPTAKRDSRQHAEPVDLPADVAVVARPAQQLQSELLGPAGLPAAKGRDRLFVGPHPDPIERIGACRRIIAIVATALSLTHLGSLMRGVRSVDEVGADERAASLAKRSIKKASKLWALDLAVRCMDLTTLEGSDTPGKVTALCAKGIRPKPGDPSIPSVAAICVYPARVADAIEHVRGSRVKVASVATAFPSGQSFTSIKVAETEQTVRAGAHEIDMVIDRGAFLSGDYQRVYDEIVAVKEACGDAHLKVILETGELGTYDAVRRASILSMAAGADFIKTSTGKVQPAATLPVSLVMMEAIRDFVRETGRPVGFKAAGGIRSSKQAIAYLVLLYETLGADWMTPDRFRLGASTLLNDVLMQIEKERTGVYQSPDYFTID